MRDVLGCLVVVLLAVALHRAGVLAQGSFHVTVVPTRNGSPQHCCCHWLRSTSIIMG